MLHVHDDALRHRAHAGIAVVLERHVFGLRHLGLLDADRMIRVEQLETGPADHPRQVPADPIALKAGPDDESAHLENSAPGFGIVVGEADFGRADFQRARGREPQPAALDQIDQVAEIVIEPKRDAAGRRARCRVAEQERQAVAGIDVGLTIGPEAPVGDGRRIPNHGLPLLESIL